MYNPVRNDGGAVPKLRRDSASHVEEYFMASVNGQANGFGPISRCHAQPANGLAMEPPQLLHQPSDAFQQPPIAPLAMEPPQPAPGLTIPTDAETMPQPQCPSDALAFRCAPAFSFDSRTSSLSFPNTPAVSPTAFPTQEQHPGTPLAVSMADGLSRVKLESETMPNAFEFPAQTPCSLAGFGTQPEHAFVPEPNAYHHQQPAHPQEHIGNHLLTPLKLDFGVRIGHSEPASVASSPESYTQDIKTAPIALPFYLLHHSDSNQHSTLSTPVSGSEAPSRSGTPSPDTQQLLQRHGRRLHRGSLDAAAGTLQVPLEEILKHLPLSVQTKVFFPPSAVNPPKGASEDDGSTANKGHSRRNNPELEKRRVHFCRFPGKCIYLLDFSSASDIALVENALD